MKTRYVCLSLSAPARAIAALIKSRICAALAPRRPISGRLLTVAALWTTLCIPASSPGAMAQERACFSPPTGISKNVDTADRLLLRDEGARKQADKRPKEKPIQWGKAVRGIQLGARILSDQSAFKVGDVLKFQAFGRNLSRKDISLSIGNYWKVNYKVQIQTFDGKPIYMERDRHNQAMLVAGYRVEYLNKNTTREISEARLKILPTPPVEKPETASEQEDSWIEAFSLKPGRYRVRLLSWSLFGPDKPNPASGWIPIEIKGK